MLWIEGNHMIWSFFPLLTNGYRGKHYFIIKMPEPGFDNPCQRCFLFLVAGVYIPQIPIRRGVFFNSSTTQFMRYFPPLKR